MKEGIVSQPLSTQALHSISIGFTNILPQRRRAVLAGHSAPRHYTPSRPASLTSYSSEGGSVSRPLSTQALHSISIRFTYILPQRKEGSISRPRHNTKPRSVGFTYFLQQRRRAVLAGHPAPRHYTQSRSDPLTIYSRRRAVLAVHSGTTLNLGRSDSLTSYSSEGGQC